MAPREDRKKFALYRNWAYYDQETGDMGWAYYDRPRESEDFRTYKKNDSVQFRVAIEMFACFTIGL